MTNDIIMYNESSDNRLGVDQSTINNDQPRSTATNHEIHRNSASLAPIASPATPSNQSLSQNLARVIVFGASRVFGAGRVFGASLIFETILVFGAALVSGAVERE